MNLLFVFLMLVVGATPSSSASNNEAPVAAQAKGTNNNSGQPGHHSTPAGNSSHYSTNAMTAKTTNEVIEVARRTGRPVNQVINGLSMLGMTGGAFCMVGVASFALGPVGMAIAGAVVGAGLIGYLSTTCLEDIFFNKKLDRVNYAGIPHPGYLIEAFHSKTTFYNVSGGNDSFSTSVWLRDRCYVEQIFWVHPLKNHKEVPVEGKLTVSKCLLACGKQGYRYAGLLDASKCTCADERNPDLSNVRFSEDCTRPCPGFSNETCGGFKAMDVYENQDSVQGVNNARVNQIKSGQCQLKLEGCFKDPGKQPKATLRKNNTGTAAVQKTGATDAANPVKQVLQQKPRRMSLDDMVETANFAHLEFELRQLNRVDHFCMQACLYRGYAYAAISGAKCYCSFENNLNPTKSVKCTTPCIGANDGANCGGPDGLRTVYSCKYEVPTDIEEQVKKLLENKQKSASTGAH